MHCTVATDANIIGAPVPPDGDTVRKTGPKITKKDTGNRGAEGAEGVGCGEGVSPPHWVRGKGLILYLKTATFSAFWALFCIVQLHVFQVKAVLWA